MEPPKDIAASKNNKQILDTIEKIALIQNPDQRQEKTDAFIQQRVSYLTDKSIKGDFAQGIIQDFIHPKTILRPHAAHPGFNLDDPSIYSILFDTIREFKENPDWKKKSINIPYAAHSTLLKYFGGIGEDILPDYKNMYETLLRIKKTARSPNMNFESISIKRFKNQRIAHCLERSAMEHNLFIFLGVESKLIIGGLRIEDTSETGHAFVVTREKNEYFISDPMNPILYFNNKGIQINSVPSHYPITPVGFRRLLAGADVDIIRNDYEIDDGKLKSKPPEKLIYSGAFPQ
jgi:hypothetical protein